MPVSKQVESARKLGANDEQIKMYMSRNGFSDAEIRSHFGAATASDYVPNALKRGAASAFGLPVDALAGPIDLVRSYLGHEPLGNENYLFSSGDLQRRLGVQDVSASTPGGKILEKAAEFGGGSIATGPLMAATQPRRAQALVTDVLSSIPAGAGAEVSRQAASAAGASQGVQTAAEIIGGIGGGVTTATTQKPVGAIVDKGKGLFTNLKNTVSEARSPDAAKTKVKGLVAETLSADPNAMSNIKQEQALMRHVPGYSPDLGQASKNPLVMSTRDTLIREKPETLPQFVDKARANQRAIEVQTERRFPSGQTNPVELVQDAANRRAGHIDTAINEVKNRQAVASQKLKTEDINFIGEKLRGAAEDAATQFKKTKIEPEYKAAYDAAEKSGLRPDMKGVADEVKTLFGSTADVYQRPDMPITFREIFDRYIRTPGKTDVDFQEFHSLWKRLNSDYKSAVRSGNDNAVGYINRVKSVMQRMVDDFENDGKYGDVAKHFREGNRLYKDEYYPIHREGLGGRLVAKGKYGDMIDDARVIDLITSKGGADDFVKIFGNDPNAIQLLKRGLYDKLTKMNGAFDVDGNLTRKSVTNFIRSHDEIFRRYPSLIKEFDDLDNLNKTLYQRLDELETLRQDHNRSTLARMAKAENPDQLIDAAIKSQEKMHTLVSIATKNGDKETVSRMIVDQIMKSPNPVEFINLYEKQIKTGLGMMNKAAFLRAKALAQAQESMNFSSIPKEVRALPVTEDPLKSMTGTSIPMLSTSIRSSVIMGVNPIYHWVTGGMKWFGKVTTEQKQRVAQEMILNPDFASLMERSAKQQKPSAKDLNSIAKHLTSIGVKATLNATNEQ